MRFSNKFPFLVCLAMAFSLGLTKVSAQHFWQTISNPGLGELASKFKNYPHEYAHTLTWGWDGPVTRKSIINDLDAISAQGIKVVTIEAGYRMENPYLSDGWSETIKIAVEEAKKRDMRIWIIDEGKYPSGFAGGKFSKERPDLRMQGLVISGRFSLAEGQEIIKKLPASVVSAAAINLDDKSSKEISIENNSLSWKAPKGNWQVILVEARYKTSVTRAVNNARGGKDTTNSLCDYLNPEATKQFIEFTHEQYKKHIGNEFGKTVLGFRGDEPDYGFTPWTPSMPAEFQKRKGYNVVPFLASFFSANMTPEQMRVKADYWDVWSDLFGKNFFDVQADWCKRNNLEHMTHLNHEDKMMQLVRSSGDFFRNMRHVQIPGVDAIWNQVWPDKVADFPKLASSASHLFGRPRSLSESFAAYTIPPNVDQARWCVNYQMVRGINLFEYMFWSGSAGGRATPRSYLTQPDFPKLAEYSNRAAYLLAQGKPAAGIALFHPTSSMWLGNEESDKHTLSIARELSENQLDYDFIDERSIESLLEIKNGGFVNLSGQGYTAVIIPTVSVISSAALTKLKQFAKAGGMVLFLGKIPEYVSEDSYLRMKKAPAFTWAIVETGGFKSALAKLPRDVRFDKSTPEIKYLHRKLKDGEMYFFFNEGNKPHQVTAALNGRGQVNIWDAQLGAVSATQGVSSGKSTVVKLTFAPSESKFITIGNLK